MVTVEIIIQVLLDLNLFFARNEKPKIFNLNIMLIRVYYKGNKDPTSLLPF